MNVYVDKGCGEPTIWRRRVTRYGVLEDTGPQGNIMAEYAAQLSKMSDDQGWAWQYRRLTLSTSDESGPVGIIDQEFISRNEVHETDETIVLDHNSRQTVLKALSVAAGYGDILSLYALQTGVINVDIHLPTTHKQVLKSPQKAQWLAAEQAEIASFSDNEVLEPCWLPPNRRALRTKWV